MAQVVTLVDDLDGSSDNVQTYSFAFLKRPYEIDLSPKNFEAFSKLLQPYLDAGRMPTGSSGSRTLPAPSRTSTASRAKAADRGYEISDLREWAGKNNIQVPQRGRIPATIVEQYLASQE
jgi:hypothetical protein